MARIIDLSHNIKLGMPVYPGLPAPKLQFLVAHEESAKQDHYAAGTTFAIARYDMAGNTGTYLDAPLHRYAHGADLANVRLETLVDLPGVLVSSVAAGPITAESFANVEVAGRAVLVHTHWAQKWGSDGYFCSGPYLTRAACEHLARSGAALVGIDCANIDNMRDPERPAHTILLAAGIPIVEHLRGLEEIQSEFRFFAAPPAIEGGTSFPVRAFAIVD
jgi:arylformamidase